MKEKVPMMISQRMLVFLNRKTYVRMGRTYIPVVPTKTDCNALMTFIPPGTSPAIALFVIKTEVDCIYKTIVKFIFVGVAN